MADGTIDELRVILHQQHPDKCTDPSCPGWAGEPNARTDTPMAKPDAFPPRWWRYEPGHGIASAVTFTALTVAALTEDGPWWKAALYGLGWALSAGLLGAWISRATMGRRDPVAEVLRVLLATPGPHHGYSLMRTTYLFSGRIYAALAKLEQAGVVVSELGDRVGPSGPVQSDLPRRRNYTVPESQRERAQALLAMPEPRNWRTLLAEDVHRGT